MPASCMAPVEPNAVADVQPMNAPRKIGSGEFHQQMIVIGHEHEGMQPKSEHFDHISQQIDEVLPILVIAENFTPLIAASGHMIPAADLLDPQRSCHATQP